MAPTLEAPRPQFAASAAQPPLPERPPTASPAPAAARQRLPFIDGLRGVAILAVLLFHGWLGSIVTPLPVAAGRWRVDVTSPLQFGYLGVHLFLLLSGFCLTYPLARDGAAGMSLDLRRFFRRRAWRILPPYYVSLAAFTLLRWFVANHRAPHGVSKELFKPATVAQVVSHIFMVHNFSVAWIGAINGAFWSLALEWQLYLLFPLLVMSFRRWGPARALVVALLLSVAYRTWVYVAHVGPGSHPYRPLQATAWLFAYTQVPGRMVEFLLGMIAALALARRTKAPSRAWCHRYLAGFVGLGSLGVGLTHCWSPFSPITDVIWGMGFFCLVMYAGGCSARGGGWLESPPLVALGTISYSVYLIHEPLLRQAEQVLAPMRLSPVVALLMFGFVILPLAIGCGWLYFRAVESHFLRTGARSA